MSKDSRPWVIYTRVSTDDQAEQGVSLPMQLESCRYYAKARGWAILAEEADEGWSAGTMKRPALQRALGHLHSRTAAGIIVWKMDRLTRELRDLLTMVDLAKSGGASLVSVTEAIDANTPAGEAMLNVMGTFSQYERRNGAARVKAAMEHVKKLGFWAGGKLPAGCAVEVAGERRRLIRGPHADEVAKVWQWVLEGEGLTTIAKRLQAAGVPPPVRSTKKPSLRAGWVPAHVWNLIHSPQVVGLLVDAATQEITIRTLASRATPLRRAKEGTMVAPRTEHPTPLHGLAKCPLCGSALVQAMTTGNGGSYRYLRCSLANKNRDLCAMKDQRAEAVEAAAFEAVETVMAKGLYRAAIEADQADAKGRSVKAREDKARLTMERDQLSARIAHLARTGQVGTPGFQVALATLGDDIQDLDRRLAQVGAILSVAEVDDMNTDQVLLAMAMGAAGLRKADPTEQGRVLRAMVQRVVVHADRVELDFYAPESAEPTAMSRGFAQTGSIGTPKRI